MISMYLWMSLASMIAFTCSLVIWLFSEMVNSYVDDVALVVSYFDSCFVRVYCVDYVAVVIGVGSNCGRYCGVSYVSHFSCLLV